MDAMRGRLGTLGHAGTRTYAAASLPVYQVHAEIIAKNRVGWCVLVRFGASNPVFGPKNEGGMGRGKDEGERMKDESNGKISLLRSAPISSFCLHPSSRGKNDEWDISRGRGLVLQNRDVAEIVAKRCMAAGGRDRLPGADILTGARHGGVAQNVAPRRAETVRLPSPAFPAISFARRPASPPR
jgi:hypothetical protein